MWNPRRIAVVALAAAVSIGWLATDSRSARPHEEPASRAILIDSAVNGSAEAAYQLGRLSKGVEAKVHWYEKAAEQDHVGAMCSLARLHEKERGLILGEGLGVISWDPSKAVYWYDRVLEAEWRKEVDDWEIFNESVAPEHRFHPVRWGGADEVVLSAGEIACAVVRMRRHMLEIDALPNYE